MPFLIMQNIKKNQQEHVLTEIHNEVSCLNIKVVYEYVKNRIPIKRKSFSMIYRGYMQI